MKLSKLYLIFSLVLTGCIGLTDSNNTASTDIALSDDNSGIVVSTDGEVISTGGTSTGGTSTGGTSTGTGTSVISSTPVDAEKTPAGSKIVTNFDSINDSKYTSANNAYFSGKLPSSGNVKALAILVEFSNFSGDKASATKEQIYAGLNGESNETGWESLNSFYKKSSHGKLNLTVDVVGWWNAGNTYNYYDQDDDYATKTIALIKNAVSHYNNNINYADYDSDNDGFIDAIYFIYSRNPGDNNLWAYQYWYSGGEKYDGKYVNFFVWMSAGFFNPSVSKSGLSGIDAETVIHETGHLLGLDDYYDYGANYEDYNYTGGLGGADMMDYNVGDHGPFSKLLLGWIDPIVVDHSQTEMIFKIEPASSSSDVIMIAGREPTSVLSEYFLIDYYRPEGLLTNMSRYFSVPGIRIYHADATMTNDEDGYYYQNNNAYSTNKLIEYVENGGTNRIYTQNANASNSMLYKQGDIYGRTGNWATFNWNKSYNSGFNFQMEVLSLTATDATIKITLPSK